MRNNNSNECATCFEDTYCTSSLPSRGALPALPSALRMPAAWLMAGRHRSRRAEGGHQPAARQAERGRGPRAEGRLRSCAPLVRCTVHTRYSYEYSYCTVKRR